MGHSEWVSNPVQFRGYAYSLCPVMDVVDKIIRKDTHTHTHRLHRGIYSSLHSVRRKKHWHYFAKCQTLISRRFHFSACGNRPTRPSRNPALSLSLLNFLKHLLMQIFWLRLLYFDFSYMRPAYGVTTIKWAPYLLAEISVEFCCGCWFFCLV